MEIIIGVADMKVSNDSEAVLITYSLGSCIGLSIYDSVAKVGVCFIICCLSQVLTL